MPIAAVVFDAYGTLLDVHSAVARHAGRIGPSWQQVSRDWRLKQLEYTWVRSLAGPALYRDFAHLTDEALRFAAALHGLTDAALLDDLRAAYRTLDAYPEVPEMIRALRAVGTGTAILSNGTQEMLAASVASAGLEGLLNDVLSVDPLGVFKPDPRVYRLATTHFAVAPARILFVSSNAWDAFGALEFGFRVAWVNRSRQPDEYGLSSRVTVLNDLTGLPALVAE